jgi:hypothetical protein
MRIQIILLSLSSLISFFLMLYIFQINTTSVQFVQKILLKNVIHRKMVRTYQTDTAKAQFLRNLVRIWFYVYCCITAGVKT